MSPKTVLMKITLIFTLLLLTLMADAQSNLLTGNLRTFGLGDRTNVTMGLTLISPKNQTISTNFISNDDLQSTSDASSNFAFTNVAPGVYSMTAGDSSNTRWRIPVYTNTLGTVSLASLANAGGTPPNPASNYVSQAQLTAAVAGISGGGGGATNAPTLTSSNNSIAILQVKNPTGATNYDLLVNGVLTNSTTGNAATATLAATATVATTATTATLAAESTIADAVKNPLTNALPAAQLTGTAPLSVLPSVVITNQMTNVTLSAGLSVVNPSQTNFWYQSIWVSGCTLFKFLNSTNAPWIYNPAAGGWTQGGTNYLMIQTNLLNVGTAFAFSSVLNAPNGTTGVFEIDDSGSTFLPVGVTSWMLSDDSTPDTTIITATNYWGIGYTNLSVVSGTTKAAINIMAQFNSAANIQTVSLSDSQSNVFYNISEENDGGATVSVTESFARPLGTPYGAMYNVMRQKWYGTNSSILWVGLNGKGDTTMTNGAQIYFQLRGHGSSGVNYSEPMVLDGYNDSIWLGNSSAYATLTIDSGSPFIHPYAHVSVWPSETNRAQFIIEPSGIYLGPITNGLIYNATNDYRFHVQAQNKDTFLVNAFDMTNAINGSGVTNLQASQLVGVLPQGVLPGMVVTNLPASNGSNDLAMLQAALSISNSYIRFGSSYVVSNTIFATNNILVDGCGYMLSFFRGITNSLIDCGASNVFQSFVNIQFNGLESSNYNSVSTIPVPIQLPEIYDSGTGLSTRGSSVRNRNGLRINGGGGGIVQNCSFVGFSGTALLTFNYNGTEGYKYPSTHFISLSASNNFIAFYGGGMFWDGMPSYNAFYNPSSFARNSSEYIQLVDCFASGNGIGIYWSGGNSSVRGCYADNNYINLAASGGNNNTHGDISASTFNHGTYGGVFDGASGGMFIKGCTFFANSLPVIVASGSGAVFMDDVFGGTPCVIVTNDINSVNSITYASFVGCYDAQFGATNFVNVVSSNCWAVGWANGDPFFGGNNDQSFTLGSWMLTNSTSTGLGVLSFSGHSGNGSGLTNLNPNSLVGPITNVVNSLGAVKAAAGFQLPQTWGIGLTGGNMIVSNGADLGTFTYKSAGELDLIGPVYTTDELHGNFLIVTQNVSAATFSGSGNNGNVSNLVAAIAPTVAGPMVTTNPASGKLIPSYNGGGLTNQNAANFASANTSSSNQWVGRFVGDFSGGSLTNRGPMSTVTNSPATLADVATLIAAQAVGGGGSGNVLSNNPTIFSNNAPMTVQFLSSTNTYVGIAIQNLSHGTNASGEAQWISDIGNVTNYLGAIGMNSSTMTNTLIPPSGQLLWYFVAFGNYTNYAANSSNTVNMLFATAQTNSSVRWSVGNGLTYDNMYLTNGGLVLETGQFTGNGAGLTNIVPIGLVTNNVVGVYTNIPAPGVTNFITLGAAGTQIAETNWISTATTNAPVTGVGTNGAFIVFGNQTNNGNITALGNIKAATSISTAIGATLSTGNAQANFFTDINNSKAFIEADVTGIGFQVNSRAATTMQFQIKQFSNQTTDLLQAVSSAGVSLSGINSNGTIYANSSIIGTNSAAVTLLSSALVLGTPNTNLFLARCIYTYAVQMNDSAVTGSPFLVFSNFTQNYVLTNGNTFVIAGGVLMHANTPVISTNDVIGLYDKSTGSASVSLISCFAAKQ